MTNRTSFKLGRVGGRDPHLMADVIELAALLGFDGRADYGIDNIESILVAEAEDGDSQQLRGHIERAWQHLEYREKRFGDAYPLALKNDRLRVRGSFTPAARLYRCLLACSRLSSFPAKQQQAWAKMFTQISALALKALMPPCADVRIFDANSSDRRNYYGTDLRQALPKLGRDLGVTMIDSAECNRLSSSGDYGIDLVGRVHFDDQAPGLKVILGQCASRQVDWESKRFESNPLALRGMLGFMVDPVNAVFIPVHFRDTTDDWSSRSSASGCLLVDRWRLIYLLRTGGQVEAATEVAGFAGFETKFNSLREDPAQIAA